MKAKPKTVRVPQVQAKCVNCGETRWLNPGEEPVCQRDYGPMYALAARLKVERVPEPAKQTRYCGDCDGVGWVEGGKALQTTCRTCGGSGIERVPEKRRAK